MNTPEFLEYVKNFQARFGYSNNDMAVLLKFSESGKYRKWVNGRSSYGALSRHLAMLESLGLMVVLDPHYKPSLPPARPK